MKLGYETALLAGLLTLAPGCLRAETPQETDTPQRTETPLRVCMDPDNPPFSTDVGETPALADSPGLYVEIGRRVAQEIGRAFEPVWTLSYFGKRSVRTTLLESKCDAYIGLPETDDFMGPRVVMSHPLLSLGYALVVPPGRQIAKLSDLDGLRVAVQFASPPESLIAEREAIHPFTVKETGEAMDALKAGEADVAFIWGPTAGYINQTVMHGAYRIVPVHGKNMQWQAAIGFPPKSAELRDQVDAALQKLAPEIAELARKYGFPAGSDQSVDLARADPAPGVDQARVMLAAATEDEPAPAAQAPVDPEAIAQGHELFNSNCSHCHGPDALQSERRINLRLLQHKYGDKMDETFTYTVHHGRSEKGMPNWSGIIPDEDLEKIKDWLHTVQSS
jgi:ABC-type amino acid transport substrate-binding protein